MGEFEVLAIPQFTPLQNAFEAVQSGAGKPIAFISLGTKWSPPCRYTWQTIADFMKDPSYNNLIDVFFVDQDKEIEFCFTERIPHGFPTLLVFAKTYLIQFAEEGQSFDAKQTDQKNRLIRQLNNKQIRMIAGRAIDVMNEKAVCVSCANL
jgi:thiol-disulfide isomerase/thioredoxin